MKTTNIVAMALLGMFITFTATSQNNVGVGTTTPDPSAVLEAHSTTQGFLPPRMSGLDRDNIAAPVAGLIIWCTDCGSSGELQVYNGTEWTNTIGGAASYYFPVVTTATGRIWMAYNLGATQVATGQSDAAAYGDLYQWGRGSDGHQIRTSDTVLTLSTTPVPGHGDFISGQGDPNDIDWIQSYDWITPANPNLWQGVNGTNNPCPKGFRIPTKAEWAAEIATWTSLNALGAFNSPLKLTTAGKRYYNGLNLVGTYGFYWSSTTSVNPTDWSERLYLDATQAKIDPSGADARLFGESCRCIKN